MARYIDADKLKAYLLLDQSGIKDTVRRNNHLHPDRKLELMAYIDAIEYCVMRINEKLTADVVEVVRCKDCKHCELRYPAKAIGEEAVEGYYCYPNQRYVKSTGFCSYGEKK